jgi:uncharacterized protein (TIGR03032 family)
MTALEVAESVDCSVSASFHEWHGRSGGAIAFTTYQAQRLGFIGFDGQRVSPVFHQFPDPMGLAVAGDLMAMATRSELVIFANARMLAPHYPKDAPGTHDALFLPRATYHTGKLRAHDVAFAKNELCFVNTAFSCLAVPSALYNFEARWTPRFISKLVAEDRCHLNGLATVDGIPRFVTALGATDSPGGWRANKASGGVLLDVQSGECLLEGLSMPHSPRWHDGKLWVLNSGAGELCVVDVQQRTFTPVCAMPGFLRGMCFVGPYAIVGMSQIRQTNLFGGLRVKQKFDRLLCGIAIVDLRDGRLAGTLEFTSGIHELYEVQFVPGVTKPAILSAGDEAAERAVSSPTIAYWLGAELPEPDSGRT